MLVDKTAPALAALADWRPPAQFQAENAHIFPSEQSLQWFIRNNRDQLIQAGALCQLNGRQHVHRKLFPETMLAIGKRDAAQRATGFSRPVADAV